MQSSQNKGKVEHDLNEYDKIFADLVGAYTHYIELIETDEEQETARKSLDELDISVFQFKEKVYTWMSGIKEESTYSDKSANTHKTSSSHCSKKSGRSRQSGHSKLSKGKSEHASKPKSRLSSQNSCARSVDSGGSGRSSYLDLKAEAAGLRAEASILKRKREAELAAELLDFDQKIQRAEAMEKVYREEMDKSSKEVDRKIKGRDDYSRERKRPRNEEIEEMEERNANIGEERGKSPKEVDREVKERDDYNREWKRLRKEEVEETEEKRANIGITERQKERSTGALLSSNNLDQTLLEVLQLQSAPKVDIDEFSGDVLEYRYFVETFKEVVERTIPDERGRLTRLIQSTAGEAKELIRHCIHNDRSSCYTHAMSLLKQHYGDPHRICKCLFEATSRLARGKA